MSDHSSDRQLGVFDATLKAQAREISEIKREAQAARRDRAELLKKVSAIERKLAYARGGWVMLLLLLGASASAGAIAAKLIALVPIR